jgi:hypothetical protein
MLSKAEINFYINQINAILITREHPVFQWAGLSSLKTEFMEDAELFASEPQYRQFCEAMVDAEYAVSCRINN